MSEKKVITWKGVIREVFIYGEELQLCLDGWERNWISREKRKSLSDTHVCKPQRQDKLQP